MCTYCASEFLFFLFFEGWRAGHLKNAQIKSPGLVIITYTFGCVCVCVCIRRILIYLDFFPFSYIRDDAARGPIEIFPLKGLADRFSSLFWKGVADGDVRDKFISIRNEFSSSFFFLFFSFAVKGKSICSLHDQHSNRWLRLKES